jgi:hypothetical protein
VRAAASKARWLATVGAWSSTSRAAARVSTSVLKVTWAWPPAEASQPSEGSAAGLVSATSWVLARCALAWWVPAWWLALVVTAVAVMPEAMASAAMVAAALVILMTCPLFVSCSCFQLLTNLSFGLGSSGPVPHWVARRLHCLGVHTECRRLMHTFGGCPAAGTRSAAYTPIRASPGDLQAGIRASGRV